MPTLNDLPNEVLSKILYARIKGGAPDYYEDPFSRRMRDGLLPILAVSSRWRALAEREPSFWHLALAVSDLDNDSELGNALVEDPGDEDSDVEDGEHDVPDGYGDGDGDEDAEAQHHHPRSQQTSPPSKQLASFQDWLSNSRNCDVELVISGIYTHLDYFFQMIEPYSRQWSTLTIITPDINREAYHEICELVKWSTHNRILPRLSYLSVEGVSDFEPEDNLINIRMGCPSVVTFQATGVFFRNPCREFYSNIIALDLAYCHFDSWSDFFSMLRHSSSLQELEIQFSIKKTQTFPKNLHPIDLRSLHTMCVNASVEEIILFLSPLRFRNLEYLGLGSVNPGSEISLPEEVWNHGGNLSNVLSLHLQDIPPVESFQIISHFSAPHLTVFVQEWQERYKNSDIMISPDLCEKIVVPRLTTLTLDVPLAGFEVTLLSLTTLPQLRTLCLGYNTASNNSNQVATSYNTVGPKFGASLMHLETLYLDGDFYSSATNLIGVLVAPRLKQLHLRCTCDVSLYLPDSKLHQFLAACRLRLGNQTFQIQVELGHSEADSDHNDFCLLLTHYLPRITDVRVGAIPPWG